MNWIGIRLQNKIDELKWEIRDLKDDLENAEDRIRELENVEQERNVEHDAQEALKKIEYLFKWLPYEKKVQFEDIKEVFDTVFSN